MKGGTPAVLGRRSPKNRKRRGFRTPALPNAGAGRRSTHPSEGGRKAALKSTIFNGWTANPGRTIAGPRDTIVSP